MSESTQVMWNPKEGLECQAIEHALLDSWGLEALEELISQENTLHMTVDLVSDEKCDCYENTEHFSLGDLTVTFEFKRKVLGRVFAQIYVYEVRVERPIYSMWRFSRGSRK